MISNNVIAARNPSGSIALGLDSIRHRVTISHNTITAVGGGTAVDVADRGPQTAGFRLVSNEISGFSRGVVVDNPTDEGSYALAGNSVTAGTPYVPVWLARANFAGMDLRQAGAHADH
jgi:hypothetical protein